MRWLIAGLAFALLAVGCGDGRRYDQAVAVLIDVSGTYADRKQEAVDVIKRDVLPHLVPGDTLLVVRIDSQSYDRENVEALLTLDRRPSRSNAQKLGVAQQLDAFASDHATSVHTDIPGAMMLAAEYLREVGAGSSVLLVFSDMQEDLPAGSTRELSRSELENTRVVAMNVKRLERDTADPGVFRGRLVGWAQRVRSAGAVEWRTLMDAAKLPDYLAQVRSGAGPPRTPSPAGRS
jgi:hypothetical protein